VGGQVQRLDAAAGAEVEGLGARLADGQLGQGGGGRADAQDVVRLDQDGSAVESGRQVADDPEVEVPLEIAGGVGADVEERAGLVAVGGQEAVLRQGSEEVRKRPLGVRRRDGSLEEEQAGEGRERRASAIPMIRTAAARRGLVAAQCRVGTGPEQLGNGVVGEAGGLEG
jgi:hypothetical protein